MGDRDFKLDDERQLELVGGSIVDSPDRPRYYMSDKAIEQRRAAAKAQAIARLNNTERIQYVAACAKIGQNTDKTDPEDMMRAFFDYMNLSAEYGQKIGNLTAYMAMGVAKETIDDWAHERKRKDDPRFKELALYVKSVCAAYREQMGMEGVVHPALTIFWQRNFDGFTNEDIVHVETSDPLGEKPDAKLIAEKYKDMPDD